MPGGKSEATGGALARLWPLVMAQLRRVGCEFVTRPVVVSECWVRGSGQCGLRKAGSVTVELWKESTIGAASLSRRTHARSVIV